MRTSNPALNKNTFKETGFCTAENAMTIEGAVNKAALLIILVIISAFWVWKIFLAGNYETVYSLATFGSLAGFIVALVTIFVKRLAPITAPVYAVLEGLVIGAFSSIAEVEFSGIVFQAVGLTLTTFISLLMAYKSRVIRATENFKLGVVAATLGIALLYVVTFVLSLFGIQVPYIHDGGPIGILFSLFVVAVAAFNLVLDFDFIESGARRGAPKYMEWYSAFGLLVTLIWLYIEILRLLTKIRSRD